MSALRSREMLAVWETGSVQDPLQRAATVLAAVLGASAAEAAAFDVGTRDVLLAGLLRSVAGEQVSASADCPGCGVMLDVPVDVAAITALPVHEPGKWLSVRVDGIEVPFRLPTTADLIALRGRSPRQARSALLAACLGTKKAKRAAPETVVAVEAAMEQAAPAGAVDLLVRCPDCDLDSVLPLDIPALVWAEIAAEVSALVRDVHTLATSYGWTEADVLDLSPRRRAMYLALVS